MKKDYLGSNIPKLGFGLMRLPMLEGAVDMEQTMNMVDLFMSRGFTYFDTAYVYIDGTSEVAAREALVKRYPRESFQLATKLPQWAVKSAQDMEDMFCTSLERAGVEYFDYYLLHALEAGALERVETFDMWGFVSEKKRQGRIRHIGFSYHDEPEVLDRILTAHSEAEFVQLQVNYADWEAPNIQSRGCYEVAMRHGKPVIVMEPVKGGSLVTMRPDISEPMREFAPDQSLASWALRYCASLDGIVTVLSGMSTLAQMEDNTATMVNFLPLTEQERAVLAEVNALLDQARSIPCTRCRYCVGDCPQKIDIPEVFAAYNNYLAYDNLDAAKWAYNDATSEGGKAGVCIACGQCEGICPQHIGIIEQLKEIAAKFE